MELERVVPFSKTDVQLKEYAFPGSVEGKDSMWQLLTAVQECGLKNDALMEVFYEQIADGYPVDHELAIFVFHGVYDIPIKAKDAPRPA